MHFVVLRYNRLRNRLKTLQKRASRRSMRRIIAREMRPCVIKNCSAEELLQFTPTDEVGTLAPPKRLRA